ncbi:cannabinoid receptor type 1B-like [Aplysia californica]|uniref:Cannabinoid receptor type 1B-like n=1 Tax=Aplysia californica TaxID=6500 RepID=A0ABM0K6F1_APLCA|nr:cannabinoid receptor type 1B-like [Aplysia californica]
MNVTSHDDPSDVTRPVLPVSLLQMLQHIVVVYVGNPLTLAGSVANVINIVVICRLDHRQTVNISLLAMAISDLVVAVCTLWLCISHSPLLYFIPDLPFIPQEISLPTGSWVHVTFSRITAYLTLLISAERCLCILLPMKVKNLVTIARVKAIIVVIFIWGVGSQVPILATNRFVWKFIPARNRSLLGLIKIDSSDDVQVVVHMLTTIASQFVVFFGVVVCTTILVLKLRQQAKWRQSSSSTEASDIASKRDARVSTTVTVISAIFVVCYFPNTINFVCVTTVPGYNLFQRYHALLVLVSACTFLLEAFNSSINIVVYYKFSSQYRRQFRRLFGSCFRLVSPRETQQEQKTAV